MLCSSKLLFGFPQDSLEVLSVAISFHSNITASSKHQFSSFFPLIFTFFVFYSHYYSTQIHYTYNRGYIHCGKCVCFFSFPFSNNMANFSLFFISLLLLLIFYMLITLFAVILTLNLFFFTCNITFGSYSYFFNTIISTVL